MTNDEALKQLVDMLNKVFADIQAIHLDREFLNSDNSEYKDLMREFIRISNMIFVFKGIFDELDHD